MAWQFEKIYAVRPPLVDAQVFLFKHGPDFIIEITPIGSTPFDYRLVNYFNKYTSVGYIDFGVLGRWTEDVVETLLKEVDTHQDDGSTTVVNLPGKNNFFGDLELSIDLFSTPRQLAFDDANIWVTTDNGIFIYEYFGDDSNHETTFVNYDNLHEYDVENKLRLVGYIDCVGWYITKGGDHMWVTNTKNGFTLINKINIISREIVETYNVQPMSSNLLYEANKIWMVDTPKELQYQRLYKLDVFTEDLNYTEIPVRRQAANVNLASPHNGAIYVTNFNNVSISKHNSSNGAYIKTIRTNAFPVVMTSNSDRELFVASYNGMLTTIDTESDEMTNNFSTLDWTSSVVAPTNSNSFWFVNSNGRLGKVNRSNKSVYYSEPKISLDVDRNGADDEIADDWKIDLSAFPSEEYTTFSPAFPAVLINVTGAGTGIGTGIAPATGDVEVESVVETLVTENYTDPIPEVPGGLVGIDQLLITPEFNYPHWNGSSFEDINVKPYMFIIGASNIMCIRMDHPIHQSVHITTAGQAMVSQGDDNYMGEVG